MDVNAVGAICRKVMLERLREVKEESELGDELAWSFSESAMLCVF